MDPAKVPPWGDGLLVGSVEILAPADGAAHLSEAHFQSAGLTLVAG
jgi:hypothetical protein